MSLFPVATVRQITLEEANACLRRWDHKMGPLDRPHFSEDVCHGLVAAGGIVSVTIASQLIRANVAGFPQLDRVSSIELSRLCAERPGICRAMLRLWREFVLPELPAHHAISYQDADLHSGATYRFDGWQRIGFSHSGVDQRSGRRGRNKWIWVYPHLPGLPVECEDRRRKVVGQ